ncbi:ABC transporter permease [Sodalis ligni]|uniref:Peptide/nickel transport system permease protein n=1 Tax=Sodalis ligni TaxID=2697027 RepID=A0A4R1NFB2_9GAMM|nr:ABC transporter permease [Sodalis ligni]TCL06335.1 peptide/nickel transport system permease protein [Sodalis ligni]
MIRADGLRSLGRSLAASKIGLIGWVVLLLLLLGALSTYLLPLPDPVHGNLLQRLKPPSYRFFTLSSHPLGTDQLGRDMFSRLLFGSRVSITVGCAAVLMGGVVGVLVGMISGYAGGITDRVLMRLVDMQLSIPLILLALMVIAAAGPSLGNLIIVLALTSWIRYARLVRGQVLALRRQEFVLSAAAVGAGPWHILRYYLLPNVLTPILVIATLEFSRVILLEASLSFLGLGVQPPWPSWGRMLAEGRTYIATAWWVTTFPGLAIVLTVMSANFVGDWLRDFFDPKLHSTGE